MPVHACRFRSVREQEAHCRESTCFICLIKAVGAGYIFSITSSRSFLGIWQCSYCSASPRLNLRAGLFENQSVGMPLQGSVRVQAFGGCKLPVLRTEQEAFDVLFSFFSCNLKTRNVQLMLISACPDNPTYNIDQPLPCGIVLDIFLLSFCLRVFE